MDGVKLFYSHWSQIKVFQWCKMTTRSTIIHKRLFALAPICEPCRGCSGRRPCEMESCLKPWLALQDKLRSWGGKSSDFKLSNCWWTYAKQHFIINCHCLNPSCKLDTWELRGAHSILTLVEACRRLQGAPSEWPFYRDIPSLELARCPSVTNILCSHQHDESHTCEWLWVN